MPLVRFILLSIALSLYFVVAFFLHVAIPFNALRRKYLSRWVRRVSIVILRILNVRRDVSVLGEISEEKNYLIVANHVSYIDVLAIAATTPSIFVTSNEVRETPFLGWLAILSGAIFVERRSLASVQEDVGLVEKCLKAGQNVVLFAEGTSTDGHSVLPFKKSLFESAVRTRTSILPITINYKTCEGLPFSAKKAEELFYFGDKVFSNQLLNLLNVTRVDLDLSVLPALPISSEATRKSMSELAYLQIRSHFAPILEETR